MDRDAAFRTPFWPSAPDRVLTDSGLAGELVVARTRLFLAIAVLAIPVIGAFAPTYAAFEKIALLGASGLVVVAYVVWYSVRRGVTRPWLPFATGLFDVTLISAIAAAYLVIDRGDMAVNSRVAYPAYFIALAATCLRYDVRVCITTGAAAVAQYAIIIVLGAVRYPDASAPSYAGELVWGEQVARLILLATGTWLTTTIVDRGRRLRLLSTHDALTNLYNRGYFDERVSEELLRAKRYNRPFAMALIDIDHFKAVNDRYGHEIGDFVLCRFADTLREALRRTDIVARYGGEEFAIALPETEPGDSEAKIEQVRELVEATPIPIGDTGQTLKLTFSAGVVHYPGDGDTAPELVRLADAYLLFAKRQGRNRVMGSRSLKG